MYTTRATYHKTATHVRNRRIAMFLVCILLFYAILSGVEVHAQDTPAATPQTAAPIPAQNYTVTIDNSQHGHNYGNTG